MAHVNENIVKLCEEGDRSLTDITIGLKCNIAVTFITLEYYQAACHAIKRASFRIDEFNTVHTEKKRTLF